MFGRYRLGAYYITEKAEVRLLSGEFKELSVDRLFPSGASLFWDELLKYAYPWEALDAVEPFLLDFISKVERQGYVYEGERYFEIRDGVIVCEDVRLSSDIELQPPCVIMSGAELRHGAFIRGGVLIGRRCVIGNSTEIKNSVLFDGAAVPHFNYVGDSLIGAGAHFGAGAVTSNLKSDGGGVAIKVYGRDPIYTGRRKLGAIVGDRVEVGCGSVLCPGCVVGAKSIIYPLSLVRGVIPERHIFKSGGVLVERKV